MSRTQFADVVTVRALSRAANRGRLCIGTQVLRCALGEAGTSHDKREGDGASPIGTYAMRFGLYRADRIMRPHSGLPLRPLRPEDGWCDDPVSSRYNRFAQHPLAASAERLWRDDGLYDVVIVLGHNDCPRVRGRGSAVFLHAAAPGLTATAGCITLARADLIKVLRHVDINTRLMIA